MDRFLLFAEGMGSADSARLELCVTRQCVDGRERCREDMCERKRDRLAHQGDCCARERERLAGYGDEVHG